MKSARVEIEHRDLKPDNIGCGDNAVMAKRPTGRCPVCEVYKPLTPGGMIKLHKRHDVTCAGSLQPPRLPTPRESTWSSARRATIERDKCCQKCGSPDHLEVHHITERVYGGSDDPINLIALCEDCHAEWTWCEPPIAFEKWRTLPGARFLVLAFSHDWPADVSAATFKEQVLNTIALAIHEKRRAKESTG